MSLRAVAEVNLAAIERNTARLLERVGHHTRLCAVVKADAYGHGMLPAAEAALRGGAASLAVATAEEAVQLMRGLGRSALVLGALSEEELEAAIVEGRAEVVAWDLDFVERLTRQARHSGPINVHVKLDTGLGRLGTRDPDQALAVAEAVAAAPGLTLAGAMTHFATSDSDLEFAAQQLAAFQPFVAEARALSTIELTAHAANSAGILQVRGSDFDMVRAGIALYGGDPMNRDPADHGLEPALALRSYVATVKPISAGQSTGYGRRFIAAAESHIATVPIGYGDGVVRALADNCDVLIGGRRYPVRGMVSMDNITVDVGADPNVAVGDRVTLIGTDGTERQTAEDLARRIGTISYEVLCWISKRVPRVYHHDGRPA